MLLYTTDSGSPPQCSTFPLISYVADTLTIHYLAIVLPIHYQEQLNPLENKLEQALCEIDSIKHTVMETGALIKQVVGQHKDLAQQTFQMFDLIEKQLGERKTKMSEVEMETDNEVQEGQGEEYTCHSVRACFSNNSTHCMLTPLAMFSHSFSHT